MSDCKSPRPVQTLHPIYHSALESAVMRVTQVVCTGKTLLEQASAFATQCESLASMEALSAAVVAQVAPFG